MQYLPFLAALAVVNAFPQEKGKCQKTADVKPLADPLKQITPGKAVFPCDFGASVPLGKIPTGCAKLEIIVGE